MIDIAENFSYRMRTPRHRLDATAFVGTPNFRIDPLHAPASISANPSLVRVDVHRGVVSLTRQRRFGPHSLSDAAHAAQSALTNAVGLRVHMARSAEDHEAARHLVRRRYAWRGYELDDPNSPGAAPEPERDERILFVAKHQRSTVGTLTLGLDGPEGLMAEESYGDAVQSKRAAGSNVCEVTRLAVAEDADSKPVLASLFSLAFATASMRGVTGVFVEVNPRHVVFYRRVLGFVVAAGERFCDRVKAPSVLLWLAMADLERHLVKLNARVGPADYERAEAA